MTYFLHLLILFGIYAAVGLSLNIVLGYCGLITLGHASFFAIGAYTYALLTLRLGWGLLPAVAVAVGLSGVLSLMVSLPAWRFKGDYFVVSSLAVQALVSSLFRNWFSTEAEIGTWTNLTNGTFGLANIPRPALLGLRLTSMGSVAAMSVVVAGICMFLSWLLLSSPWGRLLKATRDDELAARGLGKSARLAKLQAFAIACSMVAVAGAIYASYIGYVDPSVTSLDQSILFLSMVMVGGAGNLRGPLVGSTVLLAIPEILRSAHIPDAAAANLRLMIYGFLLVLLMHFRPKGLAGVYRIE